MSHSTVLVHIPASIASNIDEAEAALDGLLAPFDENMEAPPTPEWVNQETVDHAVEFYREHPEHCGEDQEGPTKPFEEYVTEGNLEAWREWTRQAVGAYTSQRDRGVYDEEGNRYGYLSTYNPKSRWDWWQLGGRWHGYFRLKPTVQVGAEPPPSWKTPFGESVEGSTQVPTLDPTVHEAMLGLSGTGGDSPDENFSGRADLARKRDIDFEGMQTLAGMEADARYTRYEEVVKDLEPAPRWIDHLKLTLVEAGVDPEATATDLSQEERERHERALAEARASYHAHPWVKALGENHLSAFMDENRDVWCVDDGGRETYVQRARDNVAVTFAFLKDDTWHEQGHMGWWGMSSNEKDPQLWNREFNRLLAQVPDDDWLAVVDVHI